MGSVSSAEEHGNLGSGYLSIRLAVDSDLGNLMCLARSSKFTIFVVFFCVHTLTYIYIILYRAFHPLDIRSIF